jgi:hypothetical protein
MSKYTFICEETYGVPAKRTVEFEAVSLNDILAEVEMFLRGSGFYFRGTLDIVNDDCEEFIEDEQTDNSIWNKIVQNHDKDLTKKFTDDTFGKVYTSEENNIVLDLGAAQPALDINFDSAFNGDTIKVNLNEEEKCAICKIPKSVMKSEKCYDANCPKTSWLMDLDYKLASEK